MREAIIMALMATVAASFVTVSTGCKGSCASSVGDRTAPITQARYVPAEAEVVVFSQRLDHFIIALDTMARRTPVGEDLQAQQGRWSATLGADFFDPGAWKAHGLAIDEPATLFWAQDRWAIIGNIADNDVLKEALDSSAAGAGLTLTRSTRSGFRVSILEMSGQDAAEAPRLYVATRGHLAVIVLGTAACEQALDSWLALEQDKSWAGVAAHRKLIAPVSQESSFYGAFRPGKWLASLGSAQGKTGHARVMLEGLVHQIGAVAFGAIYKPEEPGLQVRLLMPGNPLEPVAIGDLGHARGELPIMGGLIKPGVLGVVRLSVDPEQFYNLVRSTMPAPSRLELDKLIDELNAEIKLNVRDDIIANLTGHAVVVAYGIEKDLFQTPNPRFLADLFQLKATREALLMPISDRPAAERVLDVATQLSRGKLRRQVVRHTIQYAWIDEGVLEWALILSDDHVIVVDSAVSFDHAVVYERSPRAMGSTLTSLGITELLDDEQRSGVYLDTASLANILAETNSAPAARWLLPFKTVVLTTEPSTDAAKIELVLTEAIDFPGEPVSK